MEIYERIYDNPKDEKGIDKPNKYLGEYEMVEGSDTLPLDYSYEVVVREKSTKELYVLMGIEVSGFYHKGLGGTKHILTKLSEVPIVAEYIKLTT